MRDVRTQAILLFGYCDSSYHSVGVDGAFWVLVAANLDSGLANKRSLCYAIRSSDRCALT
eukprot:7382458-Prymnesium_polylepis.1